MIDLGLNGNGKCRIGKKIGRESGRRRGRERENERNINIICIYLFSVTVFVAAAAVCS